MPLALCPTLAVTGHYGSGKTNLSINLARALQKEGRQVTLADLDVVNPYFRSADFKQLASESQIELITPAYAGTGLDLPALTGELEGRLGAGRTVILDAGGDSEGSYALGRYSPRIKEGPYDMLFVVNFFRFLTGTAGEAANYMREIEDACRLKVTGIVNNSNLANQTKPEDVLASVEKARQLAEITGKPLLFTSVEARLAKQISLPDQVILPVEVYLKTPW